MIVFVVNRYEYYNTTVDGSVKMDAITSGILKGVASGGVSDGQWERGTIMASRCLCITLNRVYALSGGMA